MRENIDLDIIDAIIEYPRAFEVAGKWLYLYPVSLGKSLLLSKNFRALEIRLEYLKTLPTLEIFRIVNQNKEAICRIIAIYTLKTREEIFDMPTVTKRQKFIFDNFSIEDMIEVLMIAASETASQTFIKHLGLDKERKELEKISKIKNDKGNSVSFGGRSLYGSLIDAACQRYGWSYEYCVWGLSYNNLTMILADAINSVYLTDEERKKVRITRDRTRINADSPEAWAKIKSMKWN